MNLNFTIKKCIAIILTFVVSVNLTAAMAQSLSKAAAQSVGRAKPAKESNKIKPTKEQAVLMKTLEKEYDLKSTSLVYDDLSNEVFIRMTNNNPLSNRVEYGIASINGKVIIPIKYVDVTFYKGNKSNTSYETSQLVISRNGRFEILKNKKMAYKFNSPHPAMFTCYDGVTYSIIMTSGEVKRDNIKGYVGRFHGMWIYSNFKVQPAFNHLCLESNQDGSNFFSFNSSNIGLLNNHGDVICEPIYDDIIIQALQLPNSNELVVTCTYSQVKNGVKLYGGCLLNNPNNKVPVEYSDVSITPQGKWAVRRISSEPFTEYSESDTPANKYRDDGEKLYEQKKYEEVIKYYSEAGIDAPWAKFYSGISFYNVGHLVIENANFIVANIVNNSSREAVSYKMNNIIYDFKHTRSNLEMAKSLLDAYLLSDDTTFKPLAKSTLTLAKLELAQINAIELGFNEASNLYRNRIAESEKAQLADLELKRQRQAAIWGSIFNAFGNALINATAQPSKSYSSGASSRSSYTPSNTSNSSSSSSGPKAQPDQAQINKLKKNISDAQRRYQNSIERGDPAYAIKAMKDALDSHVKNLDTYVNSFK